MRLRPVALLVLLALLVTACSHPSKGRHTASGGGSGAPTSSLLDPGCTAPSHSAAPTPDAASLARVRQVLDRFTVRAWNPDARPARPSTLIGGTYVNYAAKWDGVTDPPANTNIGTTGKSDTQAGLPARHDPLNDLLTLRDVDAYLATGATSSAALLLRCRLNPVTQAEFVSYGVARGWVYQQLVDLSMLDTDGQWLADAQNAAARFAQLFAQPDSLGATAADPIARPDYVAECAAALVDAGARFNKPEWRTLGINLATALVAKAADPKTGLFPNQVKLDADGGFSVADPLVKVGAQAQLLDALLDVYGVSKAPQQFGAVRTALLSLVNPAIGVIDTKAGGWFYAVNSDGTRVRTAYKESRQGWMLPLLQHAAPLIPEVSGLVASTKAVVANKLYQPSSQGYPYQTGPNFGPYASRVNGKQVQQDWITTEATGIAVSALLGDLH